MLSQETYRLSELVRAKTEEIKNLKTNNENDLTLRLTQLNKIDETNNKMYNKLRQAEEKN